MLLLGSDPSDVVSAISYSCLFPHVGTTSVPIVSPTGYQYEIHGRFIFAIRQELGFRAQISNPSGGELAAKAPRLSFPIDPVRGTSRLMLNPHGDYGLLCAFGAGYSIGGALLRML